MTGLHAAALVAHDAGLCVLPPKRGRDQGTGRPAWTAYQRTRSTREEVDAWYASGRRSGLGYVTGAVSGNLVLFDFDDVETHEAYTELAARRGARGSGVADRNRVPGSLTQRPALALSLCGGRQKHQARQASEAARGTGARGRHRQDEDRDESRRRLRRRRTQHRPHPSIGAGPTGSFAVAWRRSPP